MGGDGQTMSFFESLFYGFISGFAEFLPVSSQAHQAIAMQLFGMEQREPIRDMFVHIALLIALITSCSTLFSRLRREQKLSSQSRRGRMYDMKSFYDLRLVKTAAFPMIIGLLLYITASKVEHNPVQLSLLLVLNGVLIFIPEFMRQGNKESRSMTGLDSILIGLCGALSSIPGLSRVGLTVSAAVARGADKQHALNWSMLLSVPALVFYICFDFVSIFTLGIGNITFLIVIGYIFTGLCAFIGSYAAILLIRFLIMRTGFSGFAYYSWGVALFSFILYLIS